MALRQIRIGAVLDAAQYDDLEYDKSMLVEDPISCSAAPVAPNDLVRLIDMGLLYPVAVADIDNPAELATYAGTNGVMVLAYKVVGPAGLNEYTIYAYDSSGPAINIPYVVDALGAADERWIAIGGKYNNFTILAPLVTKNPPIDADKVIYRDSTASDVLVTSTWLQIKAFLKTYFDTVYGTLGLSHTQGTDTSLGAVGTKNPPIDADKAVYRDSAAGDALVTSTWTQIKSFLKTYFDTLYAAYIGPCAFLAQPAASLDNVTGDGTEYTVVWGSEIYDLGNNFDGTSTFTAPVTRKYHFDIQVNLFGLDSGHTTHELKLVTSNRTIGFLDTYTSCPFSNCHKLSMNQDVDMDAGDTAVVKVGINGVNKTVDVNDGRSFFSVHIL